MSSGITGTARQVIGLGRPVWVKLEALCVPLQPGGATPRDNDLVWEREGPGKLARWCRSSRGEWLGVVAFEVPTRRGEPLKVDEQLVPEYALRPRKFGA
jgi:hypothetical protein